MSVAYSSNQVVWSSSGFTYNGAGNLPPTGGNGTGSVSGLPTLKPIPGVPRYDLIGWLLTLFKQHARIDWVEDDALCKLYLAAAISRIEQYTQMPIMPKAYLWNVPAGFLDGYDHAELPLRNVISNSASFYGMETLHAPQLVDVSSLTFPVTLEVGFDATNQTPDDIVLSIFELALGLYEMRSNPEMQNMYSEQVMGNHLTRYWVPRV